MINKIRRIALLLATSAGIIAATTATAHAGGYQPLRAEARSSPPLKPPPGSKGIPT